MTQFPLNGFQVCKKLLLFCVWVCVCVSLCVHDECRGSERGTLKARRSEDSLTGPVLSFLLITFQLLLSYPAHLQLPPYSINKCSLRRPEGDIHQTSPVLHVQY